MHGWSSDLKQRTDAGPGTSRSVAEVLDELRVADELIEDLQSQVTPRRLRAYSGLPTLPADERRTGLTWLVGNYGHAREHVGHIQLTKQLYQAPRSTDRSVLLVSAKARRISCSDTGAGSNPGRRSGDACNPTLSWRGPKSQGVVSTT